MPICAYLCDLFCTHNKQIPITKMKNFLSILGAMLFVCGFALVTGVDQNPVQCVYTLILMGAACVCFRYAEAIGKQVKNPKPTRKVYDYQRGTFVEAA